MAKGSNSRPARWQAAISEGRDALDEMQAARDRLRDAVQDLEDLRGEYEEWKDNLPDALQYSPVGEKLSAVVDLSFDPDESDLDALASMLDEAEGADLPLGFGKD